MVILDEGDNFPAWLHRVNVFDVIVDSRVLVTFLSVIENFLENRNVFECQLTSRVALPLHVW